MNKEYFCSKIKENGIVCGENNREKFPQGRYSTCQECRNLEVKNYRKKIKEETKEKIIKSIDPEKELNDLIEEKINNIKINDKTLIEYFQFLEEKSKKIWEIERNKIKFLYDEIVKLARKNKHLEDENIDMKTELQKIKKQIKSKNIDIKEENTLKGGLPSLSEIFN
jgi:hypothetical protein